MSKSPGEIEIKIMRVQNAWKTLAPTKKFGAMTLDEYEAQVAKSLAPRQRLIELEDEVKQQLANRDSEDAVTMQKVEMIVAGVISDPTEGADSALYEAMGYIRKSNRKSGLTRKKKNDGGNS